ncbi:uncharacterized protein K441DRAFT_249986 [Cenococcum geophilum 1.58]|uniref:uncharacterized protein n=1 Tax=Cenococcum geophilum 1.58 TaxID=794803 RepID=UPI00358F0D0E|nr:hypothetical protein K441DRAFT_249986 [Cenococcum geophilum 1.58]
MFYDYTQANSSPDDNDLSDSYRNVGVPQRRFIQDSEAAQWIGWESPQPGECEPPTRARNPRCATAGLSAGRRRRKSWERKRASTRASASRRSFEFVRDTSRARPACSATIHPRTPGGPWPGSPPQPNRRPRLPGTLFRPHSPARPAPI